MLFKKDSEPRKHHGKKEDIGNDAAAIKKAIEELDREPVPEREVEMPADVEMEEPEAPMLPQEQYSPQNYPSKNYPSKSYSFHKESSVPDQSAPLFIKVEKYKDVITTVQEMKLFISGVKSIFSILQEIEQIRSDTLNIMKVTVQRLEKSVLEVDAELLRPRGFNIYPQHGEEDVHHIETSLGELQKQIVELKQELHGMR